MMSTDRGRSSEHGAGLMNSQVCQKIKRGKQGKPDSVSRRGSIIGYYSRTDPIHTYHGEGRREKAEPKRK